MSIRYIPYKWLWTILLAGIYLNSGTQMLAQLSSEDPLAAHWIKIDHLGNKYEVLSSHTIKKYDKNGEYIAQYSHPDYLDLHQIDVKDPYKIALFYRDQQKIVLLDKTLNELSEIDISSLSDRYIQLFCRTVDGYFCLFDQNQQQILLLDDDVDIQSESFPLYQEGVEEFAPLALIASQNRIILGGEGGIVISFDHLGNFERSLFIKAFDRLAMIKDRMLIFRGSDILIYDFQSFEEQFLYQTDPKKPAAILLDPNRNELLITECEAPFQTLKKVKIP